LQYGGRVCLPANSLSSPSQTMAMIPSRAMACAAAAVTATAAAIALKAVWRRRHAQRPSCPPISGAAQSSPVAPLSLGWSLTGKVVLITGAAQGVGLATARLCASAGASAIVLVDRQSDKGRTVEWELSRDCRFTSECLFVQCDVSVPAEVAAAVRQADARFGRIDCLVNAAGDTRRASLQETTVELWDALVAVNLRAPFLFTQAVSRIMQREGRGGYSVVNVASVQAHGGLTFCMAYATTKGGLLTLTRNNAQELAPIGIRVNAINMGWTWTDNEHALQLSLGQGEDWLDSADATSNLGRICRVADVARAIVFLLAGAHCTGSVFDLHPEHIPGMLGGGIGKAKTQNSLSE